MGLKSYELNKTDRYFNLLLKIGQNEKLQISDETFRECLGNPSKSQYHKYVSDLTDSVQERPPILKRFKAREGFFYTLHPDTWGTILSTSGKGGQSKILDFLKYLGSFVQPEHPLTMIPDLANSETVNFGRKFPNMVFVKNKEYGPAFKANLTSAIKGLITETKLYVSHTKGFYLLRPLTLCEYQDKVFLIGYTDELTKNHIYVFNLAQVQKIEETNEKFVYPTQDKWSPENIYKLTSGLKFGEMKKAILHIHGAGREAFKQSTAYALKKMDGDSSDKYDTYECTYTDTQDFIAQIFPLADFVEVIYPEGLKGQLVEKANKILQLNFFDKSKSDQNSEGSDPYQNTMGTRPKKSA